MLDVRNVLKNIKISPYETLNEYTPYTLSSDESYWSRKTYNRNVYSYLSANKFIEGRKSLYFVIGDYRPPAGILVKKGHVCFLL